MSILLRRVAEAALTGETAAAACRGRRGRGNYADIALGLSLSYARESRDFDDTYALKSLEAVAREQDHRGAFRGGRPCALQRGGTRL